jgi:hypothetical protein
VAGREAGDVSSVHEVVDLGARQTRKAIGRSSGPVPRVEASGRSHVNVVDMEVVLAVTELAGPNIHPEMVRSSTLTPCPSCTKGSPGGIGSSSTTSAHASLKLPGFRERLSYVAPYDQYCVRSSVAKTHVGVAVVRFI